MTNQEHNKNIRNNLYPWMDDNQFECFLMLCSLFCGEHHIMGKIKESGEGIVINCFNHGWATFDFSLLTRAVIMAHDRMIRFEISPSGPRMLKLHLHKRHAREGRMYERHPTIEDAIKDNRN